MRACAFLLVLFAPWTRADAATLCSVVTKVEVSQCLKQDVVETNGSEDSCTLSGRGGDLLKFHLIKGDEEFWDLRPAIKKREELSKLGSPKANELSEKISILFFKETRNGEISRKARTESGFGSGHLSSTIEMMSIAMSLSLATPAEFMPAAKQNFSQSRF
jgi:hypothetical protein